VAVGNQFRISGWMEKNLLRSSDKGFQDVKTVFFTNVPDYSTTAFSKSVEEFISSEESGYNYFMIG